MLQASRILRIDWFAYLNVDVVYKEEFDRWVRGDRFVRPVIRRLLRPARSNLSGMQTVVKNFRLGLDRLNLPHSYNRPFFTLRGSRKIISFGLGLNGLRGLARSNPVIAAIGFPYPAELPDLCEKYNIRRFLQHSPWVLDLVRSANAYPRDIFELWPAGTDTDRWVPSGGLAGSLAATEILIYEKTPSGNPAYAVDLVEPIREFLRARSIVFSEIKYGHYSTEDYRARLSRATAMIFLSAHESQGLACQECLSCDVPVIAWDQGYWLDPARQKYGLRDVPATSVPYFDERCGVTFRDFGDFSKQFEPFLERVLSGSFRPREYMLENLTIEKSTRRMLKIYESI